MGRYDDAVKSLCTHEPAALCRWLGVDVADGVDVIRHSENLSAATLQVDALIAADDRLALHIEFQADAQAGFDLRMLEYRTRLYRLPELANRAISQHVVMLGRGTIDRRLRDGDLDYSFAVHYLRDEPVGPLLAEAALAPLAALADLPDNDHRAQTLGAALDLIAEVSDPHARTVLARAAVNLAALRLDRTTIQDTLEDSIMPIPSLLQDIYDEGRDEGREQGLEQGLERAAESTLRRRFGPDERIPGIARRLAPLGPDVFLERIDAASSLDELTSS